QTVGKRNLEDDTKLLLKTIQDGTIVENLLYKGEDKTKRYVSPGDIPFYAGQTRIVLALNGVLDPEDIEEYIGFGGYRAAYKALHMDPVEIIEWIQKSGLRGRGGGGFLTGTKWRSCRDASEEPRYVIANGDEGDPGAFMDRSLMEGNPHAVIEGMIIGGHAIGSNQGFIYVRDEYPLAVHRLSIAIEKAREQGLLGANIFNSGFNFDIKIFRGGGAFVCGESTALMSSIEGKAGEPRAKYIHTVEKGLWDKPSNLNNVETWACVPHIMNRGWEWFGSIGTPQSKGTKVFSLVGKVKNTGLVEVPMGITLNEIIFKLGGGIQRNKKFKAVQTGGPSGGCIPGEYLDMPVDFDSLTRLGSMMGSGGMIVMDERDCMVDVARYFLKFLVDESCGKCTPCREGVRRMFEIVDNICSGNGSKGDVERLEELARAIQLGSLCALGQSAPNPVLSTIKYFREEYNIHIEQKRCPAGVCKALTTFTIDPEKCTGCMRCASECPVTCISGEKKKVHTIDQSKCTKCGTCYDVCKFDAVKYK
ncbi:MAG: NADH-ubiquinone oxidoreductase-F iron-sulfur binding region domain-containing protein, partial [Syntrophorhabdaceae bacterium]|nr:NADH-ubiquinone oxidoreductase-F iron-sulfur binding region domain-containing protein [Syntrophorhabdaceae bacterium]